MDELELQYAKEINTIQHHHWITLATRRDLDDTSFETVKTNASNSLNRILQATYPWLAEQIGKDEEKSARDSVINDYHEMFGRPGEARYEAMVDEIHKALKNGKMTPRQKAQDRKRRKQLKEQRLKSQEIARQHDRKAAN